MQTVRDATILTILILLFASVRIGPIAETDRSTELPQVQTASALPFFSGSQPAKVESIVPKASAPLPAVLPAVKRAPAPAPTPDPAAVTVTIQPSTKTEAQIVRWVETIEREVAGAEAAEDSEDLMVQIAVMLEEVGDAAIAELGDHAREAIGRVECPKTRFKLNTRF